jgi:uncharacterized protein YpiB (UPF0302 family)
VRIDVYTRAFKFKHDLDIRAAAATHPRPKKAAELAPDLHSQYEELLHTVWDTERRERMMDRIDAALDAEERRPHHDQRALRGAGEQERLRSRDRQ